jgi:hypothetical protein
MPDKPLTVQELDNYFLGLLGTIRQYVNAFLSYFGLSAVLPTRPLPEQLTQVAEFGRRLSAVSRAAQKDREEILAALQGIARSLSGDPKLTVTSESAPTLYSTFTSIADILVGLYSFAAQFPGGLDLINYINPYSSVVLSATLADLFAKMPVSLTNEEIFKLADEAAVKIISDPKLHKGFTPLEIAELAKQGILHGLLTSVEPEQFTQQLISTIEMIAPVKYIVFLKGKQDQVSISQMIQFAKNVQAMHPYATREEISHALWMVAEINRMGGKIHAILRTRLPGMEKLYENVAESIRRSQLTVEELEALDEELTKRAVNSYLGSMIGGLIMSVRNGFIRKNTPAYHLYELAITGRPLPIIHPNQIIEAMTVSGLSPAQAALIAGTPDVNRMYLTPLAAISARLTQFSVDWLPRIRAIFNMYPGKDRFSAEMRRQLIGQAAANAGIPPGAFFALMTPDYAIATSSMFRVLGETGRRKEEIAGYKSITALPWLSRLFASAVEVGKGKKESITLEDILQALGIVKLPAEFKSQQGFFPTPTEIQSILSSETPSEREIIEGGDVNS